MFKVNEYKIVFKRVWTKRVDCKYGMYAIGDGRYDTVCEIYVQDRTKLSSKLNDIVYHKEPSFTGIARLHPNDTPDKIVGKKIALRNALDMGFLSLPVNKDIRTAIWKAFWEWVAAWKWVHP